MSGANQGLALPPLRPWEGSWAIVHRESGECALELFKSDKRFARAMNGRAYRAEPIGDYLARINASIAAGAMA